MHRERGSPEFRRTVNWVCAACLVALAMTVSPSPATAQMADTRQIDAYLRAIQQADTIGRMAALERFAAGTPASSLRVDALEWIVWDEKQTNNAAAAANWAEELLKSDPDNALGLAMAADAQRRALRTATARHPAYEQIANHGLWNLDRLRRPEGMSHDEFSRMRRYVEGILSAAVGSAQLERKEYVPARLSLAKAVNSFPDDAHLVYGLALADLSGDKPDRQQGYWMLARAVNLSAGTPAARAIEEFGRKRYKQDGGSDSDWDRFLVVTSAPGSHALVTAAVTPDAKRTASEPAKKAEKKVAAKNGTPRRSSKSTWKGEPEPAAESTLAANSLPPISSGTAHTSRTGPPVSLGILIETSTARKGTREAIVYGLTDLVRRLGAEDEAFILSFSNDLVFEQDLTGDAGRLQEALDNIKPHPGTALMDAAGFAAGHLRRISKNDSRVLLVISDGKNASSRIPALASSSEIRASGVKIYCIGMDVAGNEGIYRLQGLASATGGTTAFVTAPDQFRAAAQQVAGHIGIQFDY